MTEPSDEPRQVSAKRAGLVTVVGQLLKMAVQIIGMIAFSHLLSPRDIGLIGMLIIFIALGDLIRDLGLSQAAIQAANLTPRQASNLFWTNTAIGVVLTLGMALAAPLIADLYAEPALRSLAPWAALSIIINAIHAQFQVHLVRNLRFVALAITDTASQIIGLACGLTAALLGAGYWSLLIQLLVIYGSLLALRIFLSRWRPGLPRKEPGMRPLYRYGLHAGLAQLLAYASTNVDSYTIGVRWGASALGIYNRAFQMTSAPTSQIVGPLTNVALPLLSRRRHEGGDFYPLLWKAQLAISGTLIFLFMLIGSLAEPLVHILLGPAWGGVAPILTILSIGAAIQTLNFIIYWAFLAAGKSKELLYHGLTTKPLQIGCIVAGSLFGVQGVAWGFSGGLVIAWTVGLVWLRYCDAMPALKFLRSGSYLLLCGAIAGCAGWVVSNRVFDSENWALALAGGVMITTPIYIGLLVCNEPVRKFLIEVTASARFRSLLRR
jgi:PST family polysaccharide transporter